MFAAENQFITYVRIEIGCESSEAMDNTGKVLRSIKCTCGISPGYELFLFSCRIFHILTHICQNIRKQAKSLVGLESVRLRALTIHGLI